MKFRPVVAQGHQLQMVSSIPTWVNNTQSPSIQRRVGSGESLIHCLLSSLLLVLNIYQETTMSYYNHLFRHLTRNASKIHPKMGDKKRNFLILDSQIPSV